MALLLSKVTGYDRKMANFLAKGMKKPQERRFGA